MPRNHHYGYQIPPDRSPGWSKACPVRCNYAHSPNMVRKCIQEIFELSRATLPVRRSTITAALTATVKQRLGELWIFLEKGIRPLATYCHRRAVHMKFQVRNRFYDILLHDEDVAGLLCAE